MDRPDVEGMLARTAVGDVFCSYSPVVSYRCQEASQASRDVRELAAYALSLEQQLAAAKEAKTYGCIESAATCSNYNPGSEDE